MAPLGAVRRRYGGSIRLVGECDWCRTEGPVRRLAAGNPSSGGLLVGLICPACLHRIAHERL